MAAKSAAVNYAAVLPRRRNTCASRAAASATTMLDAVTHCLHTAGSVCTRSLFCKTAHATPTWGGRPVELPARGSHLRLSGAGQVSGGQRTGQWRPQRGRLGPGML